MTKYDDGGFLKGSFATLFQDDLKTSEEKKSKMSYLLRQTPIDELSMEWLILENHPIEARAYLIDNILPQVVLGLESILKEATRRNLITLDVLDETSYRAGLDRNFNPVNRLAEYLMRNNHKHNHFNESSPYVRGLRYTLAKLQNEMFMQSGNQLAKVKSSADARRTEEKQNELKVKRECDAQIAIISTICNSLIPPKKNSTNVNMIEDVVLTFMELTSKLPEEMKQWLVQTFKTQLAKDYQAFYDKEQFVKCLMIYARLMSTDVFEQFTEHLRLCMVEFRKAEKREERRELLKSCFRSCDLDQLNELSRAQVFQLCEDYFDTCQQIIKDMIHDPRDWSTREYHLKLTVTEPVTTMNTNECQFLSKVDDDSNTEDKQHSLLNYNGNNSDNDSQHDDSISLQLGTRQLDEITVFPIQSDIEDQLIKTCQLADTVGITQNQFISIMEFIIPETAPLKIFNDCLTYLKRYKVSAEEREERRLQHFRKSSRMEKHQLLNKIFHTLDQECSGMLNLKKIEDFILNYEDGFYEAHLKQAKSDLASNIQSTARSFSTSSDQVTSSFTFNSSFISSSETFSGQSYLQRSVNQLQNLHYYYHPEKSVEINITDFKILLDDIFWPKNNQYLSGHDEYDFSCLEKFLNYLKEKLVQTIPEKIRTQIRREWIEKILAVSLNTFDNSMELVYKTIFQTLIKDTIKHGEQKQISINIALLYPTETTNDILSLDANTQSCLKYVAAIPESEAEILLDQCPQRDESNLLFKCLRTGLTLVHSEISTLKRFSRTENESRNMSVSTETNTEQNYQSPSFALAIPIPNAKKYFIGVMKVNKLENNSKLPMFEEHEIQFYRGVVYHLGFAFSLINSRYLLSSMIHYAFDWIYKRLGNIDEITFYHRCNDDDNDDGGDVNHSTTIDSTEEKSYRPNKEVNYKLCKLVSKYGIHQTTVHTDLQVIDKKKNYLYYYLFDVLESGYLLVKCVLGRKHYTFPFTDSNNKVIGIIDVCCLNFLNKHQLDYLHKSLVLFQEAYEQLVHYIGVDTDGQYNNADEYKTISKNQEETEINSQIEESKSDWMDGNNKFMPKIIVKKLAKMELSLLTSKIDKDLFRNIKRYEIRLCNSEIYLLWAVILLLNRSQGDESLNQENISKLLDSVMTGIHESIVDYDPFVGEQQIINSQQSRLNEIYEKISSEQLKQYSCESMINLYEWMTLCMIIWKENFLMHHG
uniref:EF-hand domain-containing protein n=1 Tax=Schistosoma mansoni TaxID=6183 RepID=A0A3Q0KQZ2_SCHMA